MSNKSEKIFAYLQENKQKQPVKATTVKEGQSTSTNLKNNKYHLYGDNSGRDWTYEELQEYFKFMGNNAVCKKELIGNFKNREYYTFKKGDMVSVDKTSDGFRIK